MSNDDIVLAAEPPKVKKPKDRAKERGNDNESKLEKKKKKKSRKNTDELDKESSAMNVDTPVVAATDTQIELKSEKKDKKKRKGEPEAEVEQSQPSGESTAPEDKSEKKKKKRKREEEEATEEVGAGKSEKKDKKKKRKQDESNSALSTSTATPISASSPIIVEEPLTTNIAEPSKSESSSKKDKKKKRKNDESAPSTSTPPHTSKPAAQPSASEISSFLTKHSVTVHMPHDTDPPIVPILSFAQLDIPTSLAASFAAFKEPTPIQACTWPPALEGKDVVGIAETGSGKTLAFGIPALARLISSPPAPASKSAPSTITTLIVSPTRELAIQTHDSLSVIGEPFGIASVAVFGGVPKEPQVRMLKNLGKEGGGGKAMTTRIIVGTPGRILDLVQEGACDLSRVDYLVLDEADRMLDKGFENDIRNIISHTKQGMERQTMMFSATWPEAVRRLASTFQQDPVRVTVGSDDLTANSRVEQIVHVFDDSRTKDTHLLTQLRSFAHPKGPPTTAAATQRILIFALYKKEASRVEQLLKRQGYAVGALHGDMHQNARMSALDAFRDGSVGLLVATDVAARGLDIPDVMAVINYSFPLTIEDYVHRIGRTGRGGRTGKSITFFTGDNHERALAGELARVLRESGFECEGLKKFPMTIKKKTHSAYGAFYRDDIPVPKGPTKIVF